MFLNRLIKYLRFNVIIKLSSIVIIIIIAAPYSFTVILQTKQ